MKRFVSTLMIALALVFLLGGPGGVTAGGSQFSGRPDGDVQNVKFLGRFATSLAYVVQFYPLWFTFYQGKVATKNRLVGPVRISPLYQIVVAINDDTVYASTFLDLTDQPIILTIPPTQVTYSILKLDPYGDIFHTSPDLAESTSDQTQTYALTGPGWSGTLPPGVTQISYPLNFSTLIFRADKFSPAGVDQHAEADLFRRSLNMRPMCDYIGSTCPERTIHNPLGGNALILPELAFVEPFKTAADTLVKLDPIGFLRQLQIAVKGEQTPALSPYEQALSDHFDELFGDGNFSGQPLQRVEFRQGTQTAHQLILDRYLNHTDRNNWINFENIGSWGPHVIERSSITEFIQFGNGFDTAAYFHTFKDANDRALNGSDGHVYELRFLPGEQPDTKRFWSLTCYTPESIELIENPINKYLVASYTPGLQTDPDGTLRIYISHEKPDGVPESNWLPAPDRPFNLMLRDYGPTGRVSEGRYIPPPIQRLEPNHRH